MTSHASREFMEKPMGHFQYSTSSIYVTIFIYCRQCANISEHRKWYWNFYWHKSWFEVSTSRTYSDAVVPLGHKLFYVDITFSICSFFWGGMAMCWNIICSSIFLSLGLHCCHCTSETRCYCFCRKWWYWYFTIWSLANTSNIHSRPLKVIVILWQPSPPSPNCFRKNNFCPNIVMDDSTVVWMWVEWKKMAHPKGRFQCNFNSMDLTVYSVGASFLCFFSWMSNNKNKYSSD